MKTNSPSIHLDDRSANKMDDKRAVDEVFSLFYEELRRRAANVLRKDAHATINPTALLHEAWFKLRDSSTLASKPPEHFKAIAACAMRQVLVDAARRRNADKRGSGEINLVAFDEAVSNPAADRLVELNEDLLALDRSLTELAQLNPRQVQMVEFRFFLGLSVEETADELGVSKSAIDRDWRAARAFLASKIRPVSSSAKP